MVVSTCDRAKASVGDAPARAPAKPKFCTAAMRLIPNCTAFQNGVAARMLSADKSDVNLHLEAFNMAVTTEGTKHFKPAPGMPKKDWLKDDTWEIVRTVAPLRLLIWAASKDLRDATDAALDIDNWLRVMAFQSLTMTVDSYNNDRK